jgi:glycine C-acetyltransferase
VLDLLQNSDDRRTRLWRNARHFRREMADRGFDLRPGDHPIVPIMIYDAKTSGRMADDLLDRGIYVVSFSHPVVPKEEARIRVQLSAAHSAAQINRAVDAFTDVAHQHDLLP